MLLKDARDEFLFDCECKHLAKGTIRNYKAETRFLVEFLELKQVTEVEEVKAHHIRDFMKQKQDRGCSGCYENDILKHARYGFIMPAKGKSFVRISAIKRLVWWGESLRKYRRNYMPEKRPEKQDIKVHSR